MGRQEAVLEAVVDFEAEFSVVGVRGANGECMFFAPSCNHHVAGILDVSFAPAPFGPGVEKEAIAITRGILEQLNVTGVLCVEFFMTREGRLLVNELAPRPHNSGHLTIDACITSQFEQQLRSVCGLPLGSTQMLRPAAMANLLGDVWNGGEPRWEAAMALPEVKLHLYGKSEARAGRKMGHLTATADTASEAEGLVRRARSAPDALSMAVKRGGNKGDVWLLLIGLFKLVKGISLLILGFGLLRLLHRDVAGSWSTGSKCCVWTRTTGSCIGRCCAYSTSHRNS